MNSKSKSEKLKSIRVFGQRSLSSTLRSLPPNPSRDSEGSKRNQASRKSEDSHLSLSNFLDRKLQKSTLIPQTVPGKSTPFLSPLGLRKPTSEEQAETVKQVKEKNCASNDKVIFEGFKQTEEEKVDIFIPPDDDELENSLANDIQESRKRKNPFEGGNENQSVRKHVVVLGGESKLKPKAQSENDSSNNKSRPLYNHYANGHGWWDYDMEGVDNEELGFNEVWEGVGSTTLGGLVVIIQKVSIKHINVYKKASNQ